ncbi:uncharacterized protein RAG0_00574 [Rhynchosporium agropyri]|uniref:Secreted protein n=3 Tax=Rhynchosporium TaxID=38037 RepID=A0A1E1M8I1_RHYSE|nr:uncharacterized protein RCO7_04443 [Rhynchosporium commune]CZS89125.1 uncharacterized protein RAG0_00574 [Rhynchosporium agropyri]CZT45400.1 uncharacterized protein RSE6_05707 [Rhynchosporium secalis]
MQLITAALLLPALALANPVLQRQKGPPADEIKIVSAQTSGNGCPQGTVTSTIDPGRTLVTFGFDAFQTYIGPNAKQADKTKQCQIHLSLQYPGGFQYSVVDATYHGWARLDAGVTGTFVSSYFFSQAASQTCSTRSTISGKQWLEGDIYTKQDLIESTAVIWSPCGASGILNVNNRIALSSTNAKLTGELSNDDATVSFTHQLHVAWQPCVVPGKGSGNDWTIGGASTAIVE